jgi:hypothetical protein
MPPPNLGSIQLSPLLLRAQAPDLVLRQGMTLAARVLEIRGRMGIISLAGTPLTAELPEQVAQGDRLRLTVAEVTPERVVLRMTEQPQAPTPPAAQIPLPDGRQAAVHVEEREARPGDADEDRHAVSITYESPSLGAIDFHLALAEGGVTAGVRASYGASFDLAEERAGALREAIAEATGRPASVTVVPRRDPLDLYA